MPERDEKLPVLIPGCIGASHVRGNKIAVQFTRAMEIEYGQREKIIQEMLEAFLDVGHRKTMRPVIDELFLTGAAKKFVEPELAAILKIIAESWKDIVEIQVGTETRPGRVEVKFSVPGCVRHYKNYRLPNR